MKSTLLTIALSGFAAVASAQLTLTDLGQTAPTPGPLDASQLLTSGDTVQLPDGAINSFYDNTSPNPCGTSFTAPASNPGGYTISGLAVKFGGGPPVGYCGGYDSYDTSYYDNYWGGWQISLYQLSGVNNSTATLIYTNTVAFINVDQASNPLGANWLQFGPFVTNAGYPAPVVLQPGGVYAWTIYQPSGYDDLAYSTNKPYLGGQILEIPPGGGTVSYYPSDNDSATFDVGLTPNLIPLAATDSGQSAPVPGAYDAYQLLETTSTVLPDGGSINDFYDNTQAPAGYVGTSFSTGSWPAGYALSSLSIKFGGSPPGYAGGEDVGDNSSGGWLISIYKLSGAGNTNATLIYANNVGTVPGNNTGGDWINITGFWPVLQPNSVYAWTILSSGYDDLGYSSGTPYSGGTICQIPAAGGLVTFDTADPDSATFDAGLAAQGLPAVGGPSVTVNPVYALSPVTFSDTASGTGTLTYQWQTNTDLTGALGGTWVNVTGATNLTLPFAPATSGSTYTQDFRLVVTDPAGSTPSGALGLVVNPAQTPVSANGLTPCTVQTYAGGSTTFTDTSFVGTTPITYQWQVNTGSGFTNILGATNTSLMLANIQAGNVGSYQLVAFNSRGSNNDASVGCGPGVIQTLLTPPSEPVSTSPQNDPYVQYTDGPYAYWRLQENANPNTSPPLLAYDYSGNGFYGTYGAQVDSVGYPNAGPEAPAFPGFSSNELSAYTSPAYPNGFLTVPPLNLTSTNVSFVAWINPDQAEASSASLLFNRNGSDASGFGFNGSLNGSGMPCLGFTWDQNASATWGWDSGLYPLVGVWSLVAYVITPSNETTYLYYVDPHSHNPVFLQNSITLSNDVEPFSTTSDLGSDPSGIGRTFSGYLAEMALYQTALSQTAVQNIFLTALNISSVAPSPPPTLPTANVFAGESYQFNGTAGGTGVLAYQWMSSVNGNNSWANVPSNQNYSGTTGAILTINNATLANSLYYEVVVANNVGTNTSGAGQLIVTAVPTGVWTANFQLTNATDEYGFVGLNSYTGHGVLGTGTYWNVIPDPNNAFAGGTFASLGGYLDNGTTPTGISVTITGDGFTSQTAQTPASSIQTLLDQYIQTSGTLDINGLPDGTYNLAVYTIDGSFANDSDSVTVNAANGSPVEGCLNQQDKYFSLGDNTSLFTNVQSSGGTLPVNIVIGNAGGNADFCGLQIQLVSYANTTTDESLSYSFSGNALTLTWAEGQLQSTTNLATGPWVNVTNVSPITVNMTNRTEFYRLMTAP
jgi:hypothetical protein